MKTQEEVINDYLKRHTPFGPAIRSELSGIWNNGYHHGYETAEKKAKDKYEADDGRYELWQAIKKIVLEVSEGGLPVAAVYDIFGSEYMADIVHENTPEEIIEKVKSYEESKKPAPTNRDKFEELFHEQFPRLWHSYQIAKNGYTSDNGFFIPDSWLDKPYKAPWLDKPYEEPADGN